MIKFTIEATNGENMEGLLIFFSKYAKSNFFAKSGDRSSIKIEMDESDLANFRTDINLLKSYSSSKYEQL